MKHAVMKMNDVVMGSGVAIGLLVVGVLMAIGMMLWEIDRSLGGHEND